MKTKLKYLIPILLLLAIAACTGNRKVEEKPAPLYPQPKSLELNTDEGYAINSVSGDSIKPLVNSLGDTVKTGVPIPTTGKKINPDSVAQPKSFDVPPKDQFTQKFAQPNVHHIPEEQTKILVNKDSLTKISLSEIAKNDNTNYIINTEGDSIKTGIFFPAKGKIIATHQPQGKHAQLPRFNKNATSNIKILDFEEGLPSSYILSLLEDKKGNLWFCSLFGGVSVYNGKTFIHYTEKEGFSNENVRSILEDKNGNLWFGTAGDGVIMYNGESFTHYSEFRNNVVLSILEDRKGNLWFGTSSLGVCMYNGTSFIFYTEKEGLLNNKVNAIEEDAKGNLWFGTTEGACMYNGESFTHFTEKEGLSNNFISSILEDKNGNLWFGTVRGGVCMYNGNYFTHFTEKEGLSNNFISSILEDKSGNLWFGTRNGGAFMYNGNHFTQYSEKEGLSNNNIWSITEDKKGNLWFATYGGGVNIYNGSSFAYYTKKEGLSNHRIWSIYEDHHRNIWFGTYDGVNVYNGESFTFFNEIGLKSTVVSIYEDKKGNLWFSEHNGGVVMYDGVSFIRFTEKEGLSSNSVRSILEDRKGNLWFGTDGGGVCMYNGEFFTHYTEKEGLSNNFVSSILEDKNGNLWFGTGGGGLCMYNGESFTHFTEKEGLSNNFINSILEDKKGNIWFGSSYGVNIYDGETFTYYTEKEGLSNNMILSIKEDQKGQIWLSTRKWINKLKFNDSKFSKGRSSLKYKSVSIRSFENNDGLKGRNGFLSSSSVLFDSSNKLWWGNMKGLVMLDMNKFRESEDPPIIYLKQLYINQTFIDYRNITDKFRDVIRFNGVKRFENYPLNLELPYDKNHLTFQFAAIDWSAPHEIQYSYMMDGLNTTWSQPSREAKADYRNLPYGTYTFKVRAIGASGEWSEPFEYTFTIHPPWWHTWWARTAYGIAFLLLIFGTVRWRTAKLKQRQKELETEVEVATEEIREQKNEAEKQRDEVRKQKEVVEEAHKEIRDSINYAKRIQSAILPPQKLVKEYLPESFILYKPKDVVAGDFYWMEHKEGKILFAAADCTGHGVPGAMVSVVCNNGLNRSVREHNLIEPGKILDKTRELVLQEFEKSEEEVKDGMDISLCALEEMTLKWAGANNPIWIIRNGELLETKPDKQAIGKVDSPKPFTTHEFTLQQGDSIYIFTDGFQDQFGGEKGKKLKPANFKKLLLSIQQEPMEKQCEIIDRAFEEWKGNLEQVDDVCVIGVKI